MDAVFMDPAASMAWLVNLSARIHEFSKKVWKNEKGLRYNWLN